jgi:hypothetical protein
MTSGLNILSIMVKVRGMSPPSFNVTATIDQTFPTVAQVGSAVPARLGLKAAALAFSTPRPGQSRQPGPGPGLARPRPRLLYVKCSNFAHRSVGCTES